MIKKHPPGSQTHTEVVHPWLYNQRERETRRIFKISENEGVGCDLFEGIFVEESEELQNGEVRVELYPLQVGVHKPVEEITALPQEPGGRGRLGGGGGYCVLQSFRVIAFCNFTLLQFFYYYGGVYNA